MHLIYLDESGNTGNNLHETQQPVFVLTALPPSHIGEPPAEFLAAYEALRAAQQAAVAAVRPGVSAESVDAAARGPLTGAGHGRHFLHRTGHGIGLDGHEAPYIVAGNTLALEPGMAFSVEPGVYLEGRYGARIEDIVVCTADGAERLNHTPRELVVVA